MFPAHVESLGLIGGRFILILRPRTVMGKATSTWINHSILKRSVIRKKAYEQLMVYLTGMAINEHGITAGPSKEEMAVFDDGETWLY